MSRQGIGFSFNRIVNADTLKKIKLIHNSFSSKTKKFNLEQGKEQSG